MTLKTLKMSAALAAILAAGTAYAGSDKAEDSANATYTDKAEDLAETTTESDAIPSGDATTTDELPLTADSEAPTDPVTETGMEDAEIAEATTEMTVADMLGMNVLSANDEVIGEIDYVVNALDGQAAVIGIGGFLGLGEYTVAIDVDEFAMTEDDQLKLSQYTEEELEAMPQFDETGVESLPDDTVIEAQF
ncbi:MAG: PRC-barrel domain-containing protein [Pseudomonadota bacterium]